MLILISILLVSVLAALIWIGGLLRALLTQVAAARLGARPIDDLDFKESDGHLRDWIEHGARTVHDQLLAETWLQRRQLTSIQGAIDYLRRNPEVHMQASSSSSDG